MNKISENAKRRSMVKGAEIIQENLSQMKQALKESKKSTDGRIIESRSSGTKFFSSFQHKSMGG